MVADCTISYSSPVLCDFGEAQVGTTYQAGDIMPGIYRAGSYFRYDLGLQC